MKVCVLSSGSKGNSTLVMSENTKLLIDLGTTSKYVEDTLKELDVSPKDIDAVLITHIHIDHIKGLKTFVKKYKPLIFVTGKLLGMLEEQIGEFEYKIYENKHASINDIDIDVIPTSHDAGESMGFIITSNKRSMVYITDTGYINTKYHEKLSNKNLYILESNHDIKMLIEGPYPYYLQQRVRGDKGHLSNEQASNYLMNFIGKNTNKIIFAHISEKNNTPEKVVETFESIKEKNNIKFDDYIIAKQNERTDVLEV